MTNDQIKYAVGGLLVGGLATWFVVSPTTNYGFQGMMGQQRNSQNQMMSSTTIDAHFIEQMIPHHEDAITMANIALDKAQHSEIKQLAQEIINSQGNEINQMKAWYKDWFSRELPTGDQVMQHHGMMGNTGMHMGMMGNATDIQNIEQATDFDKAFIEHMIPHHQMAVMMASMLKASTERPEMQKLSDDIIAAQTKEIDEMRQWHAAWY